MQPSVEGNPAQTWPFRIQVQEFAWYYNLTLIHGRYILVLCCNTYSGTLLFYLWKNRGLFFFGGLLKGQGHEKVPWPVGHFVKNPYGSKDPLLGMHGKGTIWGVKYIFLGGTGIHRECSARPQLFFSDSWPQIPRSESPEFLLKVGDSLILPCSNWKSEWTLWNTKFVKKNLSNLKGNNSLKTLIL